MEILIGMRLQLLGEILVVEDIINDIAYFSGLGYTPSSPGIATSEILRLMGVGVAWVLPPSTPLEEFHRERQSQFTFERKLHALTAQQTEWHPQAGDFYTLTGGHPELFYITRIENERVYTCSCLESPGQEQSSGFPLEGFTSKGFGLKRVHVPEWIFDIPIQ